MDEGKIERDIPLTWIGAEELPLLFVNRLIGQAGEDHFVLTLGQSVPPALIGTPEQKAEQLEQIAYVPVKPIARLAFTRRTCQDLIAILQTVLEGYDQREQGREDLGEL